MTKDTVGLSEPLMNWKST